MALNFVFLSICKPFWFPSKSHRSNIAPSSNLSAPVSPRRTFLFWPSILCCHSNSHKISCTSSLTSWADACSSNRDSWGDRAFLIGAWYCGCRLLKNNAVWMGWAGRRDEWAIDCRLSTFCNWQMRLSVLTWPSVWSCDGTCVA